nr:RNA-directed DNA polymerase, eukaryota [Tanacetum cinerariifolium]
MEGYSFTWSHSSASKMSKLDRFLVSEGIFVTFPTISAICLDRYLSDHRPILLNEIHTDYGPTLSGCIILGSNGMVLMLWESNASQVGAKKFILDDLVIIDKNLYKAIRGVFVNGDWYTDPSMVKEAFLDHFTARFKQPLCGHLKLNMSFPNRLSYDQVGDLDKDISIDEVRKAMWDCAVNCFFDKGRFPRGSNSSFIALIPKVMDAKFITDFRPISLIDGPFILNEVLAWCKRRRKQALVFKLDFAKAYDSVRWDFLLDVLLAFGFGPKWCQWIRGIFSSNMASILINGGPSSEFPIFSGLKQGDPLAHFLFILVMESLHLSITRAVNDGIFKGLRITGLSSLSHLFYADDAVFIGEWSIENLNNLLKILNCFHLALGLCINVNKSHVLAVGVPLDIVRHDALRIGCEVMQTLFKYLGVMVGDHMSRCSAWSNTIQKVHGRLSRLRNNFFKGGDSQDSKITWVAWAKVLSFKKNRGLGASSFFRLQPGSSSQMGMAIPRSRWFFVVSHH